MKLPAIPVHELEDATLDFEALESLLTQPGAQLPFLQLLSAQKLRVNFGFQDLALAAASGGAAFINHGLGAVPVAYGAIADRQGAAIPQLGLDSGGSPTSTQIRIDLNSFTGANVTGTWRIRWWAIG